MAIPVIKTAFSRGEIAPALFGHTDWAGWGSAATTMRNMFVGHRGGAYSRAGTAFIGFSKQNAAIGQAPPRLIRFQFNIFQGYCLEFGDQYIRFISRGGFVVEGATNVDFATQGVPCVITDIAHGYSNGDWVEISDVGGMTQLNGNTYQIGVLDADNYAIQTPDGTLVDSTNFGAYTGGGTARRLYTITSPYAAVDLPLLKYTESADVLSLTHPNYAPQELKRFGPTNWTIAAASFASSIVAPGVCTAAANVHPSGATSPPTLPCAYAYVVTAIDPKTGQESVASPQADVTDSVDMDITAGSITVSWSAVSGASYYNVYRSPASYNTNTSSSTNAYPVPAGTAFGLVGQAFGNQFIDSNSVIPDLSAPPPQHRNPLAPGQILRVIMGSSSSDWSPGATCSISSATGSGFIGTPIVGQTGGAITGVVVVDPGQLYQASDTISFVGTGTSVSATLDVGPATGTYPGVVTYFQQRRVYLSSYNSPDTYWMSQPGAFLNFDSSIPVIDSDAITGTPWAEQVDGIQWAVSMPLGLVVFTGNGIWQVGPGGSAAFSNPSAITPSNQLAVPQSSVGSSDKVQPIRINWDILYAQAKGSTIRDLSYQIYFNIYTGNDISWQSSHLFEGFQIEQWAWCEEPYRVLWAMRDDGSLLSLTYVKDQEVIGWARHDTLGFVRSVCAVTEAPVDALYLATQRFATGVPGPTNNRYMIERMDNRLWDGAEDTWAVDAAVRLPLTEPNANLYVSAASGTGVSFQTSPGVWVSGHVGQIIRSGGGIARITTYVGPTQVNGDWIYPCQDLIPDDPNGSVAPQAPGGWSVANEFVGISGLSHLAGMTVTGLADGVPIDPQVVTATGTITLSKAASDVLVGLGFTAQLQSDYTDAGSPTIQGRRKNIPAVTVRVEATSAVNLQVGANQADSSAQAPAPSFSTWTKLATAARQGADLPATYTTHSGAVVQPLFTGDIRVPIRADWKKPGQVAVQQTKPLALNVLAFIPELLPGDLPTAGMDEKAQRPQAQPRQRAEAGSDAEIVAALGRFTGR